MKDYKQLAYRYLIQNKKRTALTVMGVALSVMIIFAFINGMISFWITQRNACREAIKHEVRFWCESKEEAEAIAGEKYIKSSYVVSMINPESEAICENVLCVNFVHPYQMNVYLKRAADKYGVTYEYTEQAAYYFTAGEGNLLLVVALLILLFAFIFAILGVAVVRNSIQLISLEQVKDYGILRCIGSTKEQLRRIVYFMGFILEMSGIVLGIGLGFGLYLVIAYKAKLEIGFHIIGVFFILLAFLGDLYFVMQENCKFVNRLTPVAAVRGEFKIDTGKIKSHGKGIAGRILGIEGEYATKSLKRNPARMWKSVGAMAMGIAMVVVVVSVCSTILNYVTRDTGQYGWYQLVNAACGQPGIGVAYMEDFLLSEEALETLKNSKQVVSEKKVYETYLYTTDPLLMYNHEKEELKTETYYGKGREKMAKRYLEGELNEDAKQIYELDFAGNKLNGYDEADYKRLERYLVEGTLDLSENGIVLVNGVYTLVEAVELLEDFWAAYETTDFQVGDKIEFVDVQAYDALVKERLAGRDMKNEEGEFDYSYIRNIQYECYMELIEQGKTKSYVIEGIVSWDANKASMLGAAFVLPLDRYLQETGFTEAMISGTMYRIEGHGLDDVLRKVHYSLNSYDVDTGYLEELDFLGTIWDVIIGVFLFVMFVVIINLLNISNTTASDLHLRRKEFAQLRVLGMSKKRLIYTVMLEAVITAFLADALGVILGYGIVKGVVAFINIGYHVPLSFSWGACILMLVVNTMIICLTVYLPIRGMKIDMAEALQAAGE